MWKPLLIGGCLAMGCCTTYVAYRYIRIKCRQRLPNWVRPLIALTFISSSLLDVCDLASDEICVVEAMVTGRHNTIRSILQIQLRKP